MDDLSSKVQEILGSEEGMKQLQEMAKALGLSPPLSFPRLYHRPGREGSDKLLFLQKGREKRFASLWGLWYNQKKSSAPIH